MSESAKETKGTTPLLVSRAQARQLVEWAEESTLGPEVTRIYKQGRFAYYTDNHVVVRWNVEGLDVPDGSWIDLIPSDPDQRNGKPDTLTNMANWAQTAGEYGWWNLKDPKQWRKPDGWETKDCEKLFTRAQTAKTPVVLRRELLAELSLVVTGHESGPVALAPTREDGCGPWWVMGHGRRVAGLCAQCYRLHSSEDEMPEAYQEKKEEGKQ